MRTKELVLCVACLDGIAHHTRLEKRIIYHKPVRGTETGDYVNSMGRQIPIHRTGKYSVPYYEVNAKTIRSL